MMNTSRARSLMAEDQVDAVLSSTLENNFYLSGIWVGGQERYPRDTEFYVLSPADRPEAGTIVCSIGHADLVLVANDTITDVVTFGTFFRDVAEGVELYPDESRVRDITAAHEVGRPALDALVEAITRAGFGEASLAVEERGPNRELLTQLSERLPKARIEPGWSLLRRVRSVKTDAEIERIVAALRVNELGLRAALAAFEEGVTERAVQRAFQQAVVAEGARPGFTMVRFGRGLALGQVPPGATKLRRGDFAFFDVGVDLDGYKSDIGRVVSFGEPNPDLQQFFAASKAGQQTAIEMMAPGVTAGAVFEAAVARVQAEGIPTYRRQHVGHAVGIEYYDFPVLAPASDTALEANMTFEVETPYYRLGVGGTFIEDTVRVTESGCEILTTLSRDLEVIEPR